VLIAAKPGTGKLTIHILIYSVHEGKLEIDTVSKFLKSSSSSITTSSTTLKPPPAVVQEMEGQHKPDKFSAVTFTTKRIVCLQVTINNMQILAQTKVKHLSLYVDQKTDMAETHQNKASEATNVLAFGPKIQVTIENFY
jgi:hypothetical protein